MVKISDCDSADLGSNPKGSKYKNKEINIK